MFSRTTRSQSAQKQTAKNLVEIDDTCHTAGVTAARTHISTGMEMQYVSNQELNALLDHLPKHDRKLIRQKQKKLQAVGAQVPTFIQAMEASNEMDLAAAAVAATLVFAWEAAGTAVCISPQGILLTCSHCIAESEDEYDPSVSRWLLTAAGHPVQAKCVAWDPRRDLALLQIIAAPKIMPTRPLPFVSLSTTPPKVRDRLLCIGHPASENLETSTPGVATNYDVLHISDGRYRGMANNQDPQDNAEIGALKHDCWTYWGHSGAPLVDMKSGKLVGLHSSWDDQTAMRRGVGWEALRSFLDAQSSEPIMISDDEP